MSNSTSSTVQTSPSGRSYINNSVAFVALTLLAALLNYAYYPIIAHFLSTSAFGATQSLIAVLLQVSAVFSGLNLVTVYLVRKLGDHEAKHAIETLQKITTSLFIIVTLLVTISQSFL